MSGVKATLDVKTTTSFIEDATEPATEPAKSKGPAEISKSKNEAMKQPSKKQIKTSGAEKLAFAACFFSLLMS